METDAAAAVNALKDLPGLDVRVTSRGQLQPDRMDATLEIRSRIGVSTYAAEARRTVNSATIGAVLDKLAHVRRTQNQPPLLLATHIAPSAAERLLAEGFEFADAAGNVYLNGPAAYVLVLGNRPERLSTSTEFTPADLRAMFAFLAHPDLLRATYREIAETTGLSLGKISGTVTKLEAVGYLRRDRSGTLFLADTSRMLERWEFGYLERLRPTLKPTGYRTLGASGLDRALHAAVGIPGVLLGGEHAAARLTQSLQPTTITLHVPPGESEAVAARLKLARSTDTPTVTLVDRIGPSKHAKGREVDRMAANPMADGDIDLAHPILVRAELLATGDDRLLEIAARLRSRFEDELMQP